MQFFYLMILLLSSNLVWSFPNTIRHGYTSCTTCHVSPSGGGLMTEYGRSLSKELLSTWGEKNEEQVMHGMVNIKKPKFLEPLIIGGDARYISRRQKTDSMKVDEGFWMQAQFRFGLLFEKIKLITSLGSIENPRESDRVEWNAPEYYALLTPQVGNTIRVGRFEPMYGLRLPDHNLWIKSEPGFVPWIQRDSLEFMMEDQDHLISLGGFQSISKTPTAFQSTGYILNYYQILGKKSRLGISAMNAEGQGRRSRSLTGHGTLSYSEKAFTHFELSRVSNSGTTKDVTFTRTGYETFKGFIPFLQFQSRVDRKDVGNGQYKYGGGIQWLPRPHFELVFQFEQLKSRQGDSQENYLLFHYYL